MKYIGRFLGWILLGINLCMVVLLLVCAYSPYIDPVLFFDFCKKKDNIFRFFYLYLKILSFSSFADSYLQTFMK